MKLQYIQTEVLNITGYGEIKNGDIIDREDLVQSLKHRSDFKIINNQEVKETSVKKRRKNAKRIHV